MSKPSERCFDSEGKLLGPRVTELRTACEKAGADVQNLVIDLKNLTAISQEGENVLLELMNERVKFRCGVFTKHVLIQLTGRMRSDPSRK